MTYVPELVNGATLCEHTVSSTAPADSRGNYRFANALDGYKVCMLSLTHTHTLSLSLLLYLALSHTHTHTLTHSLTHSLAPSRSLSVSFSLNLFTHPPSHTTRTQNTRRGGPSVGRRQNPKPYALHPTP